MPRNQCAIWCAFLFPAFGNNRFYKCFQNVRYWFEPSSPSVFFFEAGHQAPVRSAIEQSILSRLSLRIRARSRTCDAVLRPGRLLAGETWAASKALLNLSKARGSFA